MSQKKRMKLCSNCDGFVDIDVIICPYCGNDVTRSVELKDDEIEHIVHHRKKMSVEETLSSLYPPPYKPKNIQAPDPMTPGPMDPGPMDPGSMDPGMDSDPMDPRPVVPNPIAQSIDQMGSINKTPPYQGMYGAYNETENRETLPIEDIDSDLEDNDLSSNEQTKGFSFSKILPILLFSLGVNTLLLGLYLLLFSANGEVFVRWNASIWYLYLLIGIPFSYVGYKMLQKPS